MPTPLDRLPRAVARPLRALFRQPEDPRLVAAADAIARSPIFTRFPRPARLALADAMHTRRYARGEFLYYEGDPAIGLYVVLDGLVSLTAEDENGTVNELTRVERGGSFGEASLLGAFRRPESAQAVRDAVVLGFFRPDLRGLLRRNPEVGLMVAVAVAQRLAAREEALLRVLREGHIPAHRLLHRLVIPDDAADPLPLLR